jgi:hypothetical protein
MVGSGWFGGLHTVTGPLFGVRQFQPRAWKSCQVWLVLCAVETPGTATVTALAAPAGVAGLVGVWLHAPATAQAATAIANPRRTSIDVVFDSFVIARMLPPP